MVATITDVFKKKLLLEVDSDLNRGNYYIGIGKSEIWNTGDVTPSITNNEFDIRKAKLGMQSIKAAEDRTFVVPRNNWSSGTIYSAYDDAAVGYPEYKYYVLTEDNRVYLCMEQPKNSTTGAAIASTSKPNEIYTDKPFKAADGYVWKFMYQLTSTHASKYLSSNYMPVSLQPGGTGDAVLDQQYTIQTSAKAGQISNVVVTNGGSGYSSVNPPTVTIRGNGYGSTATATVASGAIKYIMLDSSADSCRKGGRNYTQADVFITDSASGGVSGEARPVLAPRLGHGADPRDDLKSTALMFNTKIDGTETASFQVGNDFRQVMLLRNPYKAADSSALFTSSTGRAGICLAMDSSTGISNLAIDETVKITATGAKAKVDEIDNTAKFIYCHQNDSTGYVTFTTGTALVDSGGASVGTVDGVRFNDVFPNKFDVYYYENRAAVTRSASQKEDIKIVISI